MNVSREFAIENTPVEPAITGPLDAYAGSWRSVL